MIPYYDIVDGKWRLKGYESLTFSSEADAHNAADLALYYHVDELGKDSRYRRAAERAKVTA